MEASKSTKVLGGTKNMSDKNLILIVMVTFIMLSIYDLMTLYFIYDIWDIISEISVLVVSSIMVYVIKTNKIEI